MKVGEITQQHIQRLTDVGVTKKPESLPELLGLVPPVLVKNTRTWLSFGMFAGVKHVRVGYYGKLRELYQVEADSLVDAVVGLLEKLSIHEDGAIVE